MGSDMIFAIWPLFVTSFMGVNMEILGLIDEIGATHTISLRPSN